MGKMALLLLVIAITGCDGYAKPGDNTDAKSLVKYVDKENGVVCYQVFGGSAPLSCVKVIDGVNP